MCTIDFDDDDSTIVVWRDHKTTSRRDHRCMVCSMVIVRGTEHTYFFARWTFSATLYSSRSQQQEAAHICNACDEIRERFGKSHGVSLSPSMLDEKLYECIGQDSKPDGALLADDDYKLWLDVKDESREWREDLAAINRRYRKAPARKRFLENRWAQKRAKAQVAEARDSA